MIILPLSNEGRRNRGTLRAKYQTSSVDGMVAATIERGAMNWYVLKKRGSTSKEPILTNFDAISSKENGKLTFQEKLGYLKR